MNLKNARAHRGCTGVSLLVLSLAALAVGLFVLIGYALVLGDNPAPTSGDQTALDIVNHLQAGWLTELNKIITALGSTIAVLVVAVVAAAFVFRLGPARLGFTDVATP